MKKYITKNVNSKLVLKSWVIGFTIFVLAGTAYAQNWQHQDVNTTLNLYSVHFVDSDTGWVAGANDSVFKTTDGGQIWKSFSTGASSYISDLHFLDSENGWLSASNGVKNTENGGESWTHSYNTTTQMFSVYFIDGETGWAAGASGTILSYSSGTWQIQTSGTTNTLNSIFFIDGNTGWAAGAGGVVLRTTNGGGTWQTQTSGTTEVLNSIFFIDGNTGWIVGENGTIRHTTDGGLNWADQGGSTPSNLFDIYFINNNDGWIVGSDGTILSTGNGGDNWGGENSGTSVRLSGIYMLGGDTGFAVGLNGISLSYGNHPQLSPPDLVSPGVSETDVIFRPLFEWEDDSNAATFNLQISTDENFADSTLVLDEMGISGSSYSPDNDLKDETVYFWRVQSVDDMGGTSSWSAARSFTTTEFWISQNPGSTVNLSDIHFGDTNIGWVAGEGGVIWRTSDAGVNWSQSTLVTNNLNALHFSDTQNGWAVGDEGIIIHTSDSFNWSAQGEEITSTLLDVYFADASTGWVIGVNGFLSKTSDGGVTWQEQNSGTPETLWGAHFVSSQVGWITGANGTIARTDNGGESWQTQVSGVSGTLNNVFFLNAEFGWIAGRNGVVLRTKNGGIDWEKLETGHPDAIFQDVSFVSNERGWVVGESGLILSTKDGGDTWQEQKSGTVENLTGIHFVVAGAGWVTGDGGTVLKWYEDPIDAPVLVAPGDNGIQVDRAPTFEWEAVAGAASYILQISTETTFSSDFMVTEQTGLTGTTFTPGRDLNANTEYFWRVRAVNSTGSAGAWSQVFSFTTGLSWRIQQSGVNYLLYDIHFYDEENGWAVGDTSTVLQTSDGGDNWEFVNTGNSNNYRGVYFTTPETGFIIGTDGSLLQTENGGANWQVRSIGAENSLLSIDFSANGGNGLIVGVGGTAFRTTDGGGTWNAVNSNVSANLWYVYYLNDNEVWATGTQGTIIHSFDGGETWETQQTLASGYSIYGLHFIDSERGWASGTDGIVLRTSNGGITWDNDIYTSAHLDKVHFTDEATGWIVGSGGTMLNTTNGGITWDLIETPTSEYLVALSFVGPGKGWAAGSAGTILHYSASVSELPAPFLELPVAGETGVSLLPKLTWESVDQASEYQVQVATDPNFGFETKVSDDTVSETFYTPEELQFESFYYWRVRGVDSDGFGGAWSDAQTFTTVDEGNIYADLDVEGSRLPVSGFFTLTFNLGITESSLLNAVEIKDSDGFVYILSVNEAEGSRGSELRIHSETSFRSNDEITVTINSSELVSRKGYNLSGLVDRTFTFTTSFLGDFDNDAGVNSTDLAEITSRWKVTGDNADEEISMFDIGPASGSGTQFRAEPDSVIDFEDLIMFAFNWNLSLSGAKEQGKATSETMAAANQKSTGRSTPARTYTDRTNFSGSDTEGSWPYFMKQAKEVLEKNVSGASFHHSFESGNIGGGSATRLKAELKKSSSANRTERVKLLIPGYNDRYQTKEEAGLQEYEKIALVLTQPDSLMAYEVYVQAPTGISVQDLEVSPVFEKHNGQSFILSKTHTSGNGFIITAANLGKGIQLAAGDTLATFSLNNQTSALVDLSVGYTLNESTKKIYKGVYNTVADVPGEAPEDFELLENYPNPFNPVTEIRYHIPEKAQVRVMIYDILGRRISTITDQQLEAGFYRARWDASRYASGVYLYVIQVRGDSGRRFTQTKKMTLIK